MILMTLGAKVFWCCFTLTYVAGFALVKFIDELIWKRGDDTQDWTHWATLITIWLLSPLVVTFTIVWMIIQLFSIIKRRKGRA